MAGSIGELFVDLGFNVDDEKLKAFNSGIQNTVSGMEKLLGVSASPLGFLAIINNAANAATQIQNLNTQMGISTKYAQGFAAAFHEANPLASFTQGLEVVRNVQKYITDMQYGKAGNEAAAFGVTALDNTPEKVTEKIRKNYAAVAAQWGPAKAAEFATAIYGTSDAINVLTMSQKEYNEASAKGIASAGEIADLVEYNKTISDISNSLDRLKISYMALPAKGISEVLHTAEKRGVGAAVGEFFGASVQTIGDLVGWKGLSNIGKTIVLSEHMQNGEKSSASSNAGGGDNKKEYAIGLLEKMGWKRAVAEGMVDRLDEESTMDSTNDPRKHGRTENAYGLAQWQVPRQRDFKAHTGKDIHSSTFEEQMEFINYELTKGAERAAGMALQNANSREEAKRIMKNGYERPASSMNINHNTTIHVTDKEAAAREFAAQQQRSLNTAAITFNSGAAR